MSTQRTLEDIMEQTTTALQGYRKSHGQGIKYALESGKLLNEARHKIVHGDWLVYLEKVDIHSRTAQAWMRLASTGLRPETIAHFGGIRTTLEMLSEMTRIAKPNIPEWTDHQILFEFGQQMNQPSYWRDQLVHMDNDSSVMAWVEQKVADQQIGERKFAVVL